MDVSLLGTYAPHEEGIFFPSEFDDAIQGMEQMIRQAYPSKVPLINETNEAIQRRLFGLTKQWLRAYINVATRMNRGMNFDYKRDVAFNQALRAETGFGFADNVEMAYAFNEARKKTNLVSEAIYNPNAYFKKHPEDKKDISDKVLDSVGAGASKLLWVGMIGLVAYGVIMSSPKLLMEFRKAKK